MVTVWNCDGTMIAWFLAFIKKISPFHIKTVAPQDGLKKNAKENTRKIVAMPTLRGLPVLRLLGVSVTIAAAVVIQAAMLQNRYRTHPGLSGHQLMAMMTRTGARIWKIWTVFQS